MLGIVGKNGIGKTTLIDLIMGFRWPDAGEVKILGKNIRTKNKEYLKDVSYLAHDVQIAGGQTIASFLKFHSFFYEGYSEEIEKELLVYFSIDSSMEVSSLSTGQQKKILIVAALASGTKLIVIDEITAVLDSITRKLLFKKLNEHVLKFKKTVVIATNISEDLVGNITKIFDISAEIIKE